MNADPKLPRGIRNNNPFNIRKSPTEWKGEVIGLDDTFETYDTPIDGIRAGCKILRSYKHKYGIDTVRKCIERFAPPNENDTSAYMIQVAHELNVGLDDIINLDDEGTLFLMARAIIRHENGQQPYGYEELTGGVKAALEA